jgi:hypothetical protein
VGVCSDLTVAAIWSGIGRPSGSDWIALYTSDAGDVSLSERPCRPDHS